MKLILGIVSLLILTGIISAAADCASGPFKKACSTCAFDENGKMDQACWKNYESEGQTCIGTSYPVMAIQYDLEGCNHLDLCVQRLTACKETHRSGSDRVDCNNPDMIDCYKKADVCAEAASKICTEGKSEDETGFNNESAGGWIKDNSTKTGDNYDKGDGGRTFVNWVCGDFSMILLILGAAIFMRKE